LAFTIVWKRRAVREVTAAQRWWVEHRLAAPLLLRDELARVGALLTELPELGPAVHERDARRVVLPRTGYVLFYRVRPRARRIEVIAFVHGRRADGQAP
jgi:toxin ParE1/3/4